MTLGLIGKKVGMTREFFSSGTSVPITVLKVEKGRVIDVYTREKNGYSAVKLGFLKIKKSKLTNQMKGFFTKRNTEAKKILKEYRIDKIEDYKIGNEIGLEIFKDIKFIDVKSKTIGKGFAGVMKKYNFAGLKATHGVLVSHRSHGSTGQRQDPGKVFKGKKMAGHMGAKYRTILNLEIVRSDPENNLIYIKGSIPGSKNQIVYLRKSVKSFNRKTILEKERHIEKILAKETVQPSKKKAVPKTEDKKKDTKDIKKTENKKK